MLKMCNLDYLDEVVDVDIAIEKDKIPKRIKKLKKLMQDAVKKMDFESAIKYRDEIEKLKKLDLEL